MSMSLIFLVYGYIIYNPKQTEFNRVPGIQSAAVPVVVLFPPARSESDAVDGLHGEQHFAPESDERGEEEHHFWRRPRNQIR